MTKKRILFASEASFLSTGYATIYRELIKRFYAAGDYDVAEFGNYGRSNDPRAVALPWKFYGVLPQNDHEMQAYKSNEINQFGAYKIEAVLAEYQPDIVYSILDPWMMMHLKNNRYRNNYKLVLTPTVDSAPQKKEWIDGLFRNADALTTYSRYAKKVLESDGLKIQDVTSPGVDIDVYKPMDKFAIKDKWCLKKDLLVIGTVMRNQRRKLFPDLFNAYAELRKKYKDVDEVKRSVLYCHTSWPDLGWDLPELLTRSGIQRHVIFTYKCKECKSCFLSWFIPTANPQAPALCRICGKDAAMMPNTHDGVSVEEMAEIYNLMDIYVHPAICEGWGMPIAESKSCGVPGLYQNYSAVEDHVENGGGLAIDIAHSFTEAETMAIRTYPSIQSMVKGMHYLLTNRKERIKLGEKARKVVESLHTWDIMYNKLKAVFDKLPENNRMSGWNKPPSIISYPSEVPNGLQNHDFIFWCYKNILKRDPDEKGFNDWMSSLAKGTDRQQVLNFFKNVVNTDNQFESIRWQNSLQIRNVERVEVNVETDILTGAII